MDIPENKYLGKLCKRGHDWNGTGRSLRRNNGHGCIECVKEYGMTNKIKEYKKEWAFKNKIVLTTKKKKYRKINNSKRYEYNKKYCQNHKDEISIYMKEYQKNRRKNINHKLNDNISRSISNSLKGNKNGYHWESLVGYTIHDLKNHLEKQFKDGMSWQNKEKWHIDHIIPISVFNFSSPEHIDFKRCWALENLQPLWAKDNKIKHAKITNAFQPSLKLEI